MLHVRLNVPKASLLPMDSASTSQPPAKDKRCNGDDLDRFSNLPDPVLHLILSRLDAVEVVRTSVLSSKWRKVWASVPSLSFLHTHFNNMDSFASFISTVFHSRDASDVQNFSLYWNRDYNPCITTWLRYVVMHNVQTILVNLHLEEGEEVYADFDMPPDKDLDVPHCLFTCHSLSSLNFGFTKFNFRKLRKAQAIVRLPEIVTLSALRSLRFDSIGLDLGSTLKLCSGCPILEVIHFSDCWIEHLDVRSSTLQKLYLDSCVICSVLRISAPCLKEFSYSCSFYIKDVSQEEFISLENLSSLEEANISCEVIQDLFPDGHALENFAALSNVQVLDFSNFELEFIFSSANSSAVLPTFYNMKDLRLTVFMDDTSVEGIVCLLHCSPNLEYLQIEVLESDEPPDCWNPRNSDSSILDHLKIVKISAFYEETFFNNPNIYIFMQYIISHAKALSAMVIRPCCRWYGH